MKWALMYHNMICSRHYWIWVVWTFFLHICQVRKRLKEMAVSVVSSSEEEDEDTAVDQDTSGPLHPSELFRCPTRKIRKYRNCVDQLVDSTVWCFFFFNTTMNDAQKILCNLYIYIYTYMPLPPWWFDMNVPSAPYEEEDGPDDVNGDEDSRRTMVVDAINFVIDNNVESWNTRTQTVPGAAGERWSLNREHVIHLWKKSNTRGGCFKMKKMNYVDKADMCYQKATCELAITLMVVEGEPND